MPRGRSHRRSEAARRRLEVTRTERIGIQQPSVDFVPLGGTGKRHKVRKWEASLVTPHQHKLVIPDGSPDKQFILVIGASHLRSFADGIVRMPGGRFVFGFMSTPGAAANDLRLEVLNAEVSREPDAVCILATSNDLTASNTPEQAGQSFERYLKAVLSRWPKAYCISMVPRLTESGEKVNFYNQEFHRRAKRLGVSFTSIAEYYPRSRRQLWCRDGIHLSDDHGMPLLAELIWMSSYQFLETPALPPPVQRQVSHPYTPRFVPRLVLKGVERPPPPPPSEWTSVKSDRKRKHSGESESSSASPSSRVFHKQADGTSVALRECFIPLNPVRFSEEMLVAMEKVSPSALGDVPTGNVLFQRPVKHRKNPAVLKTRRVRQQDSPMPCMTDTAGVEPPPRKKKAETAHDRVLVCDVQRSPCPGETSEGPAAAALSPVAGAMPGGAAIQGPAEGDVGQRTQTSKGQAVNLVSCVCSEGMPLPLVPGRLLQNPNRFLNIKKVSGCNIIAAIKHTIFPVCTWNSSDVDEIVVEGSKFAAFVARKGVDVDDGLEVCKLVEQQRIFGGVFKAESGNVVCCHFDFDKNVGLSEVLQACLKDGMCVIEFKAATILVIRHHDYFVVVDCAKRNSQGMSCEWGTSVLVFNTCLNDLILHILNLSVSLNTYVYSVWSISVVCLSADMDTCAADVTDSETEDGGLGVAGQEIGVAGQEVCSEVDVVAGEAVCSEVDVVAGEAVCSEVDAVAGEAVCSKVDAVAGKAVRFVRGSFHQGDERFLYSGVQCTAVSAVALIKHKIDSVFSWQSDTLDNVVVLGDELYTNLRKTNVISGENYLLSVLDLPEHVDVEGHTFQLKLGDFVSGYVERTDVAVPTLQEGLDKLCTKYETCFIIVNDSTCALISDKGRYALVDSHSRNSDGRVVADGKSIVLYFSSLKDVFHHLNTFAGQSNVSGRVFEISGVSINMLPKAILSECSDEIIQEQFGCSSLQDDCAQALLLTEVGNVKPKCSTKGSTLKKFKSVDVADGDDDVDFVCVERSQGLKFNPLSKVVAEDVCKQLKLVCEKGDTVSSLVGDLGVPCKLEKIVGDGNCFFRALSQAVGDTQKGHRKIRLAVVKQLEKNPQLYCSILRDEYSSVSDYISRSRMQYVGSWATEVEIQAAADCLGVDIFTYYIDKWLEYKCHSSRLSSQSIYLQNVDGNHYETVVCVKQPQTQSCYGYCKEMGSNFEGYYTRKRVTEDVGLQDLSCVDADSVMIVDGEESVMIVDAEESVMIVDGDEQCLSFNPVCNNVAMSLCKKLNIDSVKQDTAETECGSLGDVCETEKIREDGNSFFRAVGHVISGSQKTHRKIRLAVVSYMEKNADDVQLLGSSYVSVSDYLERSKMKFVGHEASEIEIHATAKTLGVNVYIHNGTQWTKYNCLRPTEMTTGIYLRWNSFHFDVVSCVNKGDTMICYGLCKVRQFGTLITRGRTLKAKQCSNERISTSPSQSRYFKKKQTFKKMTDYHSNLEYKETVKFKNKLMYQQKDTYKQNKIFLGKRMYREMYFHKQKVKALSKKRYEYNVIHKEKVKALSKEKYKCNILHKEKVKAQSKEKYQFDLLHKEKVKAQSKEKYQFDLLHKEKVKALSKEKYQFDLLYKQKVKALSIQKYKINQQHRRYLKDLSRKKYHGNAKHRQKVLLRVKLNKKQHKEISKELDIVIKQFLEKVQHGPDFVCCVCHRLLFRHQVLICKKDYYSKSKCSAVIAEKCIVDDYVHKCNVDCRNPCNLMDSARGQLMICYTCHYKINKGEMPPESSINNLGFDEIPSELASLNSLEQHLIALHIPFMKMLALPKGGQNGVHGPVTCVPANLNQTCNVLPRSNMEGSLLAVKLKRKLTFKGHYKYQYVDTLKIQQALRYLKRFNKHYKDVEFNDDWINDFSREVGDKTEEGLTNDPVEQGTDDGEDELLHDRQQHCMFQDTCLMPVDLGQEALDQYFDNVLNVAPGEGNNPVKLLSDPDNEAKSFPALFPTGNNTYHTKRPHRLTLSRYFNNRLLHVDGRCSSNVEYIFYAQYMSELEQVISNVSIALRKKRGGKSVNLDELLKNEESLKKMMEFDDGYRFLKPIRGTPAFWQSAQRDIIACVRQLGKPTWFSSFSSADMRWKSLLNTILIQEGRTQTVEQLEYADKCELLRRNPVTAARLFDFRWHIFLREVLMSSSNPVGKIVDYYYRVEFQQRGSPHCHCLFWVEGAPVLDRDSDDEVIAFIDKYVTCELPSSDDPLYEEVSSVQQHSKRHSKSCRKKSTVCRFNFPRPASSRTFICRKEKQLNPDNTCQCNLDSVNNTVKCTCSSKEKASNGGMDRDFARDVLTKVKNAISDEKCAYKTVEEMFSGLGISQEVFETAYKRCSRNTHVVLKREMNEIWINQYSRPLLKAWNANIDIQYCVDAYACCVYIISYMSKTEREMGLLLGNAQREASKEGNVSAKEALKRLGSVYLHNRDVCAQEAVYRLTNMHLKECSRKVVFIPTGDNVVKMSLPISILKQRASSDNLTEDNMWMTGLVDRYKNRPKENQFEICLAKFVSEYRVLSKNEKCKNAVKLNNGFGFVAKRTRTQPAVIRYARFSETKDPEKFYQSILQLFLPYRHDSELKPSNFETFQDFYTSGVVRLIDGRNHSVKSIVDLNRSHFEQECDSLEAADHVVGNELLEDAWCELCPEVEAERLECEEGLKERRAMLSDEQEHIPDLSLNSNQVGVLEKRNTMSRTEGLALIRSLNEKQLSIFYEIRQWCLDKVNGKNPEPLSVFINGGGGTGKSHLIRAIEYESKRILSSLCKNPDNICVLLTAPTGIAAYNLETTTIHTTFSIGMDVRLPYTPLGEEKLNSLRTKYCDLQLVIIDEISMVDHNLLSYIHGRLRQIKQTGNFSPFGNTSIIAVGDFFQLAPVRGKPLYSDGVASSLWCNLFKVVELTEIVRQKDVVFSQLLNRMRTRSKGTPLLPDDINILKSRETGEVSSALHIFATNKQVNEHNIHKLKEVCVDFISIRALDYVNDNKTGKLKLMVRNHAKATNSCLSEELLLGKGARVMLIKNVDVADGLVNGVCGYVTDIVMAENKTFPKKVFVKFDDDRVGIQRRRNSPCLSSDLAGSTAIEPEEERATVKGGLRRQFPLKLAWACTVHKVQGLTVDKAVVCLSKIFAPGQAYVALSRVKSISGLTIQEFDAKRIYCKDDILDAVQNMTPLLTRPTHLETLDASVFTVFLMNVQSLNRHFKDLACCTQQLKPKCIAVTETWVSVVSSDTVKIDGYSFHNCPRSLAYSGTEAALISLKDQLHGGVGMYTSEDVGYEVLITPNVDLECLVTRIDSLNIVLVVLYRPPQYPLSLFKINLGKLLDWLESLGDTVGLLGDFNDDILKSSTIFTFMNDRGYVQLVKYPSTERGTLIDHVYFRSPIYEVETTVVPTYFSDHEGIMCGFKLK